MAHDPKRPGKRLRVGAFIGNVEDPRASAFWEGARDRALERGAEIIGYLAPGDGAGRGSAALGVARALARGGGADGVIALSSAPGDKTNHTDAPLSEIGLPAVSAGCELEAVPGASTGPNRAVPIAELAGQAVDALIGLIESGEARPLRLERGCVLREGRGRAAIPRSCLDLLGQDSLGSLVRKWEAVARDMGMPGSALALFEGLGERGAAVLPARSRLVEASSAGEAPVELRFPTESVVPEELRSRDGAGAWIVAPLVRGDEALGYLLFEGEGADPEACEALRAIMSSALGGAPLLEGGRGGVREREELEREIQEISNRTMQAIGQDLHDDLCPHLVGISMLASVLEESLSSAGSASAESAREIHELLRSAIERSRQFARTLYPPRLAEEGLASAVEDLVETQARSAGGVSISLQTEGDCAIGDVERSLNLFRIIQEALTNALRHSGSDDVIVRLVRREGELLAEVRDFGRGMPPGDPGGAAAAEGRGMGLRIMRYRAEAIGARLEISGLDPGIRVSCVLADG